MGDSTIKDAINLGPRLHTIASYVTPGAKLGDIGTDHAYLPVYLLQNNRIHSAIGVDIHKGPYESAQQTVKMYGFEHKINIRQGNGLVPLQPGEIDTLVIAGMGGTTILEILHSKPQVLAAVSKAILQPQGAEDRVRKGLTELTFQGWRLNDECLVEEDGRKYSVMVFTRTEGLDHQDIENIVRNMADSLNKYIEDQKFGIKNEMSKETINNFFHKYVWTFGPIILEKKDTYLQSIIEDNIINLENIGQQMKKTAREEIEIKSKSVEQERKLLEVMQRWLFQ